LLKINAGLTHCSSHSLFHRLTWLCYCCLDESALNRLPGSCFYNHKTLPGILRLCTTSISDKAGHRRLTAAVSNTYIQQKLLCGWMFTFAYSQWLKCNGTQGNAVSTPPIYDSKRSPPSDCYNALAVIQLLHATSGSHKSFQSLATPVFTLLQINVSFVMLCF